MITDLRFSNFKAWRETGPIQFAPITVLFGTNSSGKSSIQQFLLMLKQTAESPDRRRVLHPGGEGSTPTAGSSSSDEPVTPWALSRASNPAVLRLHTSLELTEATIETCPPSTPPHPLDRVLQIPGIRSIDLHRYRGRLNLLPGSDPRAITRQVCELLAGEWGRASAKRDEAARTFPVPYRGPRLVAESLRMAGSQPILRALFAAPGVVEAILEPGHVRVRLGRLFSWTEAEEGVRRTLEAAG
jgi:hypothetical protein